MAEFNLLGTSLPALYQEVDSLEFSYFDTYLRQCITYSQLDSLATQHLLNLYRTTNLDSPLYQKDLVRLDYWLSHFVYEARGQDGKPYPGPWKGTEGD